MEEATSNETKWTHPEDSTIRIRVVRNQTGGEKFEESYQVIIPKRVTGNGRKRRQFRSFQAAKTWARAQYTGFRELGRAFSELETEEQHEAAKAIKRLREHGISLAEATDFAIKRMRPKGGDRTVAQVVQEILTSREERAKKKSLRPESVRTFRVRAQRFSKAFGDQLVKEIGSEQLKNWFLELSCSTRSNKNYFDILTDIFKYAKQRNYIADTPLDELTDDDKREICGNVISGAEPPEILTVEEAKRLLDAALLKPKLDLLAAITLALFCGIRTEELTKLNWSHLKLNIEKPEESYVTVPAGIAKKRRIRHVPIPGNALAWLMYCPDQKGPVTRQDFATDYRKRFQKLLKEAGFVETDKKGKQQIAWKRNAMRHSFGSYHYALHGDSMATARLLGHRSSDDVLFAHYRDLVNRTEAEKYFALVPPASSAGAKILPMPKTA